MVRCIHICGVLGGLLGTGLIVLTLFMDWTVVSTHVHGKLFRVCDSSFFGIGIGDADCLAWTNYISLSAGTLFCTNPSDPSSSDLLLRIHVTQGLVVASIVCALLFTINSALYTHNVTSVRWPGIVAVGFTLCCGIASLITWATFIYACDVSFCNMNILAPSSVPYQTPLPTPSPWDPNSGSSNGADGSNSQWSPTPAPGSNSGGSSDGPFQFQMTFCSPGPGTYVAVIAGVAVLASMFPLLVSRVAPSTTIDAGYTPIPAIGDVVETPRAHNDSLAVPDYYAPRDRQGYCLQPTVQQEPNATGEPAQV